MLDLGPGDGVTDYLDDLSKGKNHEKSHQIFVAYLNTSYILILDQQDLCFLDPTNGSAEQIVMRIGGSDLSSQSLTTNPTIRCTLDRKQATGF